MDNNSIDPVALLVALGEEFGVATTTSDPDVVANVLWKFPEEFGDTHDMNYDELIAGIASMNSFQYASVYNWLLDRAKHLMLTNKVYVAYGQCLSCRSIEVRLNNVLRVIDLSYMGESPLYPQGYGCELCG